MHFCFLIFQACNIFITEAILKFFDLSTNYPSHPTGQVRHGKNSNMFELPHTHKLNHS